MNAQLLPSSLVKALHSHIAAWANLFRCLPALKPNQGFDGFLFDQYEPGTTLDEWSPGARHTTPGNFKRAGNKRHFATRRFVRALGFLLSAVMYFTVPAPAVWAHGGASVGIDSCRIPVGNHWVHFTAYTPAITGDAEYCRSIPDLSRTNLVFDYEGKQLRKMTLAFEITKEPEGSRVYYQEPKTQKTGSVNAVVDFNRFGAGDYLIHVTLVNEGQKIDAHLPFSVGSGGGFVNASWLTVLLAIAGLIAVFFFVPSVREKLGNLKKRGQRLV